MVLIDPRLIKFPGLIDIIFYKHFQLTIVCLPIGCHKRISIVIELSSKLRILHWYLNSDIKRWVGYPSSKDTLYNFSTRPSYQQSGLFQTSPYDSLMKPAGKDWSYIYVAHDYYPLVDCEFTDHLYSTCYTDYSYKKLWSWLTQKIYTSWRRAVWYCSVRYSYTWVRHTKYWRWLILLCSSLRRFQKSTYNCGEQLC